MPDPFLLQTILGLNQLDQMEDLIKLPHFFYN